MRDLKQSTICYNENNGVCAENCPLVVILDQQEHFPVFSQAINGKKKKLQQQ